MSCVAKDVFDLLILMLFLAVLGVESRIPCMPHHDSQLGLMARPICCVVADNTTFSLLVCSGISVKDHLIWILSHVFLVYKSLSMITYCLIMMTL